ncbi:chemotaxis-specific protein-glutamate methyltransferase CheB [Trinickia dinghuensis]|uniref:Protein-glutamate methylesterase/protein-glutamine glutaminase n=1 Tax=Trinickia dinghuensis TaxID=2291023 RepID=A0A3D8JYD8_9BURK|nr:chemotaxis-specific protein-glutamate methyltransferase CheB [Trinickia dinghuensis]RDU98019.1 chemotaxis-specific protein-glutamate methyltransferase CheB [Trinickia dinghuensis]
MKLRVLIAEDSLTVRKRLSEILSTDPDVQVVGEAEDGGQAIELCRALKPDVITLDMMMPVMSGLAAAEYIMAYCPTPILVVSSSFNRGELYKTYDALAAGVVEVMEKPSADRMEDEWESRFIKMVKLVARIKPITHLRGRLSRKYTLETPPHPQPQSPSIAAQEVPDDARIIRIAAIGASTGGPRALVDILRSLPVDFALPLLVVVHIGDPFGDTFAQWLDGQSAHRVRLARDGDPVPARGVVLAPSGRHLLVHKGRLALSDQPERHSCRPSVDVLFESIAEEYGQAAVGCLLTGMGQDGGSGLLAMRRAGGVTIAQDEATSAVYGMPREAALLGAAQQVLPLPDIAPALARIASRLGHGNPP